MTLTGSKKYKTLAALAAFCAVAALITTATLNGRAEDAAEGTIKTSYAFDVTDKKQLMDFADTAFTGKVLGVDRIDKANATTVWRVSVRSAVKGSAAGTVLVRQLGFVDSDGESFVAEGQPLLEKGGTYLLVTARYGTTNELTLVAGPAASVRAKNSAEEESLSRTYADAAR